MATQQVRIEWISDTKALKDSAKALEEVNKANDVTQKEVEETNEKLEDQSKTAGKLNKAFTGLGGQLVALGNKFQIAGRGAGDLAAGMFKAGTSTSGLSKKMRILKVAIASTGIGLLVIGLAALITSLTKVESNMDKVNKIMEQVGATIDVIVGRVAKFGSGLLKLITGNKEGLDEMKNSFNDIGAEIVEATAAAREYADQQVALRKLTIQVTEATARRSRIIQDQLIITRDMTKSFDEQRAALEKANQAELANQKDFLALARAKLDLVERELRDTPENLRTDAQRLAIAEAKANVETAISNSTAKQRELLNRVNELNNRELSTIKAKAAEEQKLVDAREKAREEAQAARDANFEKELGGIIKLRLFRKEQDALNEEDNAIRLEKLIEFEEAKAAAIINTQELTAEEELLIREQLDATILEMRETSAEREMAIDRAVANNKIATAMAVSQSIFSIARASLGNNKALALAEIAFDTGIAISAAVAAAESNPANAVTFGAAGAAQFAVSLARIVTNIAAAKEVISGAPKFEAGGRIGGKRHSQGGTLIEAEKGEYVINRKAVAKYGDGVLDMINGMELNTDMFDNVAGSPIIVNNNDDVVRAIKSRPENRINVDNHGFTQYQQRQNRIVIKKQNRYSV